MSDLSLAGTVVAAATTLGGFIRWSAGRLAKSWDDLSDVIKMNTEMLTKVAEMLGRVDVRTEVVSDQMTEIHQEISGVHEAAEPEQAGFRETGTFPRAQTERAIPPERAGTYLYRRPDSKPKPR